MKATGHWDMEEASGLKAVVADPGPAGLRQFAVAALELREDGRDTVAKAIDEAQVFDLAHYQGEGSYLWTPTSHYLVPGQSMPDSLAGKPLYTFAGVNEHSTFKRPDYIRATFSGPVKVYCLWVSITRPPQWLRNEFVKLPESSCSFQVSWHFPFHNRVMAMLSQKWGLITHARLTVWERKEHCAPGVSYSFGATESTDPLEGWTYLLAWQPLSAEEFIEPGLTTVAVQDLAPDADKEDQKAQLQRIVAAVQDDDLVKLQRACVAYYSRLGPDGSRPAPPSFITSGGVPLTRVAALRSGQPKLMLYLVSQGAEMDAVAMRYALSHTAALRSAGYQDLAHLLLSYVLWQRNPVATALAVAEVLSGSAEHNSAKAKEWLELADGLRRLAVSMVDCLQRLEMAQDSDEGDDAGGAAAQGDQAAGGSAAGGADDEAVAKLEDVLAPLGVACTLNDASPLQLAYDTKDLEFMSASVVQGYLQKRWLGTEFILLVMQDEGGGFNYQSYQLILRLAEAAGFVGGMGAPALTVFSYLMHILVFAARAFFNSPRGRWIFRMLCEIFFLYIYHTVQLYRDETTLLWQHWMLVVHVAGMIIDEVQEYLHQYQGRLSAYLSSGFNLVELTAISMLTASIGLKAAMLRIPDGPDNASYEALLIAKTFLYNTASVFVWSRLLQLIIPLYNGMGSLLMVISQMIREVFKFAIPGVIIMMGVAFTLYSMFSTLLLLFRTFLGETMFSVMEDENTTLYNLYGNIIVLLYALTATVVLANLLIAIISYHFQPEKVEAQSKFLMAEIMVHYEYMVTNTLLGHPFSAPLLLMVHLLPSGLRPKSSTSELLEKYAMTTMDGIIAPGDSYGVFFPTGSRELPYWVFLVTLYPLILASAWAIYLAMAPYCILHFAFKGYRRWTSAGDSNNQGGGGSDSVLGGSPSSSVLPVEVPTDEIDMVELREGGADVNGPLPAKPPGGGGAGVMAAQTLEVVQDGLQIPLVQRLRASLSLAWQLVLFILALPFWLLIGTLGYVLGLGSLVVLWMGLYSWFGKLYFHTYWVIKGWIQGWLGALGVHSGVAIKSVAGMSDARGGLSAQVSKMDEIWHPKDRVWVRTYQAGIKAGGQVLTQPEIKGAMAAAGFSDRLVALAEAGATIVTDGVAPAWEGNAAAAGAAEPAPPARRPAPAPAAPLVPRPGTLVPQLPGTANTPEELPGPTQKRRTPN